jgi:4-hydroxy 2-oxovalerate aldolase
MAVNVLDCTLRDGGYYGDWNFNKPIVEKYLCAVSDAKIDIIEIGFRFLSKEKGLGPFAYSKDNYLVTLPLPKKILIAVMINANEIIEYGDGADKAIDLLFSEKSKSPVDIVRIATHINDFEKCQHFAIKLQTLGYRVFLNLMQIDSIGNDDVAIIAEQINSWGCIDVLYFADSFGNMNNTSVREVIEAISNEWHGEIGIHAHDNKGHALANSISAIDYGVSYIDATILGMGRGAGNTKMENLLVEMVDHGLGEYYPEALFPIALQEFDELHKKYNWGSSIYYYLSAVHGIHPTYIQEMLSDGRYDTNQILSAIDFLKPVQSASYNIENMLTAISSSSGNERGSWSVKDWANGREILIVGSGPSTREYFDDIVNYINCHNPIVLCLNINKHMPENLITAYVACHETRITIELDLYPNLKKPIILPMSRMPSEINGLLADVDVLDYGLRIKKDILNITHNGCTLEKSLVLMYALSLSSVSGATRVLLTGVDGYDKSDPKQQEMVLSLNKFKQNSNNIEICAVTPTTYPIMQKLISDIGI